MKSLLTTTVFVSVLALQSAAQAQDSGRTINVMFAKGASSTKVSGMVKRGYIDYAVWARAGQTMAVTLKGSNQQNYMNILPPGSRDEAMFIGSSAGNNFKGVLPKNGTYKVRVYLMRSAARRGESSKFTLSIKVTDKS